MAAQVLPSGRFLAVQTIGRHLQEDDALVLSVAAAAEHRWRGTHPEARAPSRTVLLHIITCSPFMQEQSIPREKCQSAPLLVGQDEDLKCNSFQ